MSRRKVILPEEEFAPLRAQFAAWRNQRRPRSPIPDELWTGAATLASRHGICPVARALGLDFNSLKARVAAAGGRTTLVQPAFLELSPAQALTPAPGTTIEITAPDGARMSIHLGTGHGQEAAGFVAAFLGTRR